MRHLSLAYDREYRLVYTDDVTKEEFHVTMDQSGVRQLLRFDAPWSNENLNDFDWRMMMGNRASLLTAGTIEDILNSNEIDYLNTHLGGRPLSGYRVVEA